MPESMTPLVAVGVIGALFILLLSLLTNNYSSASWSTCATNEPLPATDRI